MPEQDEGAAGFYPGSTEIKQHVSIFLLGFRHAVSDRNAKEWVRRVRELKWLPHPYLRSDPTLQKTGCAGRFFSPQEVLTPTALRTIFGSSWGDGAPASFDVDQQILFTRLSSNEGKAQHVENLLLTRDPSRCRWFGRRLFAPRRSGGAWVFVIEWADVWLFDDDTGVFALKTQLEDVVSCSSASVAPTLTEISRFHRYLRDWQDPKIVVSMDAPRGTEHRFWEEVVFNEWLGAGESGAHLLMRDGEASCEVFDGFSRYCKLLTGVQVAELGTDEDEFAWSSPLADPMSGYPYQRHYETLRKGEWDNTILAFQAASIAGYPTYRDLFLAELATASDEGAAGGHGQCRSWQYSIEYLRRLFEDGGIEIWEYWSGLALRDICAFAAWSDGMPLINENQLESRYYPLYVHAYHLRFELDCIAEHCVDHELVDTRRLRGQLRRFETFRNRYWFKEITRDFQGVEVFRRMKQGMEVDALFETVSAEVSEVGDYLESMAEHGRKALLGVLIAAAYPVYLWFSHASEHTWIAQLIKDYKAFSAANPWLAFAVAVVLPGVLLILVAVSWRFGIGRTRPARAVARGLQRIYAWFDRESI